MFARRLQLVFLLVVITMTVSAEKVNNAQLHGEAIPAVQTHADEMTDPIEEEHVPVAGEEEHAPVAGEEEHAPVAVEEEHAPVPDEEEHALVPDEEDHSCATPALGTVHSYLQSFDTFALTYFEGRGL